MTRLRRIPFGLFAVALVLALAAIAASTRHHRSIGPLDLALLKADGLMLADICGSEGQLDGNTAQGCEICRDVGAVGVPDPVGVPVTHSAGACPPMRTAAVAHLVAPRQRPPVRAPPQELT